MIGIGTLVTRCWPAWSLVLLVLAANLIGTGGGGQVIAFEPNSKLCDLLRRNRSRDADESPVNAHAWLEQVLDPKPG